MSSNLENIRVSIFNGCFSNEPMTRKLSDVATLALSEDIKARTNEVRRLKTMADDQTIDISNSLQAKTKADNMKKSMPTFLTNVFCEHGKKRADIVKFLPFIGFDVDHITEEKAKELMAEISMDKHTVMVERSVSGRGIHFLVFHDADEWLNGKWDGKDIKPYEYVYNKVRDWVKETFEVEVDEKCKNPEHVFGICYDESFYFNEEAEPLHIDTSVYGSNPRQAFSTERNPLDLYETRREIEVVATMLLERGIDITDGYDKWRDLGFALASELGEDGRQIFHDVSSLYPDYNATECDKQYSSCLKSTGSGITIKTFFKMAQNAGIDLGEVHRIMRNEASSSASYANMPSANENVKEVNSSIISSNGNSMAEGGMAEVAETSASDHNGYTFSDKINAEDLPSVLSDVYVTHSSEPAKCDAMLLGALNVISGLMGGANGTPENRSGVYGIYDGKRVYAPVFNIIYSGAGNDKGNLIFCKQLIAPIRAEIRRQYEAEKQDYESQLAEYENKSRKERGEAPKEPAYRDPFVPGNSSSSAVYRSLDANGSWGLMFETEADTISNMLGSDYGDYSDMLRKTFHSEDASMNRVTEKIHIELREPRLSVFLTCTPGQLNKLFPDFENGLGSRFLFYYIPDEDVVFHDVFALQDTPLEDKYKAMGDKLYPLYHALQGRAGHPIQFVMSDSQKREFLETYSEMLKEEFKMLGTGIRAFVFRIALVCFRYAMILTTLRRLGEWQDKFDASNPDLEGIFKEEENALVCDDRDFHIAMTIIGCLINHTARVYMVLSKDDQNPFADKGLHLSSNELETYNDLPAGEFTTATFLEVAMHHGFSERTAQRKLGEFSSKYQILKPIRWGVYCKPHRKTSSSE